MESLIVMLIFKVLSFLGATLNTVGFLTFFFWPSLAPHRWHMIISGLALIAVSELSAYGYLKWLRRDGGL